MSNAANFSQEKKESGTSIFLELAKNLLPCNLTLKFL